VRLLLRPVQQLARSKKLVFGCFLNPNGELLFVPTLRSIPSMGFCAIRGTPFAFQRVARSNKVLFASVASWTGERCR
jgi:hypothetical protein